MATPQNLNAENLQAWRESMAKMADRLAVFTNQGQDPERKAALSELSRALSAPAALDSPEALKAAYEKAAQQAEALKAYRDSYTPSRNTMSTMQAADNRMAATEAALTGATRPNYGNADELKLAFEKAQEAAKALSVTTHRLASELPRGQAEQAAELRAAAKALTAPATVTPESVARMQAAQEALKERLNAQVGAMEPGYAKARAERMLMGGTGFAQNGASAQKKAEASVKTENTPAAPSKPAPSIDLETARRQAQNANDLLAGLSDRLVRNKSVQSSPALEELRPLAEKIGEQARNHDAKSMNLKELEALAKSQAQAFEKFEAIAKQHAGLAAAPVLARTLADVDRQLDKNVLVKHAREEAKAAEAPPTAGKNEPAKESAKEQTQSAQSRGEPGAPRQARADESPRAQAGSNAEAKEQRQQLEGATKEAQKEAPGVDQLTQRVTQLSGELAQLGERAKPLVQELEGARKAEANSFVNLAQVGENYGKALTAFETAQKNYEQARWNAMYSEGGGLHGIQGEYEAERKLAEARKVLDEATQQRAHAEKSYNTAAERVDLAKGQLQELNEVRAGRGAEFGEAQAKLKEGLEGLKEQAGKMEAASNRLTEMGRKHDAAPLDEVKQVLARANEALAREPARAPDAAYAATPREQAEAALSRGAEDARRVQPSQPVPENLSRATSDAQSHASSQGVTEAETRRVQDTARAPEPAREVSAADIARGAIDSAARAAGVDMSEKSTHPHTERDSWADKIDRNSDWGDANVRRAPAESPESTARANAMAEQVARLREDLLQGDPNRVIDARSGMTALMAANRMGMGDVVQSLLERGANVDALDKSGRSASDYARSAQDDARRYSERSSEQTTSMLRDQGVGAMGSINQSMNAAQQAMSHAESLASASHQKSFADNFNLEAMRARPLGDGQENPLSRAVNEQILGGNKSDVARPGPEKTHEAPGPERGR